MRHDEALSEAIGNYLRVLYEDMQQTDDLVRIIKEVRKNILEPDHYSFSGMIMRMILNEDREIFETLSPEQKKSRTNLLMAYTGGFAPYIEILDDGTAVRRRYYGTIKNRQKTERLGVDYFTKDFWKFIRKYGELYADDPEKAEKFRELISEGKSWRPALAQAEIMHQYDYINGILDAAVFLDQFPTQVEREPDNEARQTLFKRLEEKIKEGVPLEKLACCVWSSTKGDFIPLRSA